MTASQHLRCPQARRKRAQDLGIEIDKEDEWIIDKYMFSLNEDGYPITNAWIDGRRRTSVKLHQLIVGSIPKGMVIDHEDRNKRNCRRKNLRVVTRQVSAENRDLVLAASCIQLQDNNRYRVQVRRKNIVLRNVYDTEQEAIDARDRFIAEHSGL